MLLRQLSHFYNGRTTDEFMAVEIAGWGRNRTGHMVLAWPVRTYQGARYEEAITGMAAAGQKSGPKDETALAEAEIEYHDDPVTTVFVKFPMFDDLGKLPGVDHSKLYFVIWTTTIWTLPGNLGITLHPDESYAILKAPNGEMYIMAEALMDNVMDFSLDDILNEFK